MMNNSWKPYSKEIEKLAKKSNIVKKKQVIIKRSYPERALQLALMLWFRKRYPEFRRYLVHFAAERKISPMAGAMLKALGMRSGVSDLILFVPRNGLGALMIELKKPGGKLTDLQTEWMMDMLEIGYAATWTDNLEKAKQIIEDYLRD